VDFADPLQSLIAFGAHRAMPWPRLKQEYGLCYSTRSSITSEPRFNRSRPTTLVTVPDTTEQPVDRLACVIQQATDALGSAVLKAYLKDPHTADARTAGAVPLPRNCADPISQQETCPSVLAYGEVQVPLTTVVTVTHPEASGRICWSSCGP